jgi:hypothetical protein
VCSSSETFDEFAFKVEEEIYYLFTHILCVSQFISLLPIAFPSRTFLSHTRSRLLPDR